MPNECSCHRSETCYVDISSVVQSASDSRDVGPGESAASCFTAPQKKAHSPVWRMRLSPREREVSKPVAAENLANQHRAAFALAYCLVQDCGAAQYVSVGLCEVTEMRFFMSSDGWHSGALFQARRLTAIGK